MQENCSAPAYPPIEVMVSVSVTDAPAATVSDAALGASAIVGGTWLTEKIRVALLLLKPRELLV